MKTTRILFTLLAMLLFASGVAQQRNTRLTIKVGTVEGDLLTGQAVSLTQTDYAVGYGALKLNASGECSLNVFAGNHRLEIERNGFNPVDYSFSVAEGETEKTVTVNLTEKTRDPFAVTAEATRDPFTGRRDIALSWNREKPAFFDDFESHEPFALTFGEWTGIDADGEATAPLVGTYPNRGMMQYAQIINPLTVTPTWWYEYPILRPYSGQQYVGFIRTNSGNANDDWLITPAITVGTDNIFSFKAKAADRYDERFMVYYTTKLDNPATTDFIRLDAGNYESVDYRGWKTRSYDVASLAGQQVKFAIRYISNTNLYGAFMLMVDDVYVGQPVDEEAEASLVKRARRVAKSPANRFEKFEIYLDGVKKATVEDYNCLLTDVPAGAHTIGVKAVYLQASSATTEINVDLPEEGYADLTVNVTAQSKLSPEGMTIDLLDLASASTLALTVKDGKVRVPYLPYGKYELGVAEGAYEAVRREIDVKADAAIDLALTDRVITPYNITATAGDNGSMVINWNQELAFTDSFEDYDDFAVKNFGGWVSLDVDKLPVYPIALGSQSNVVSFPGSGNANNPVALAPIVFNPYKTVPAMLPTDPAIAAATGDKSVMFCSAQMGKSDKWLITPELTIRDNFRFSFKAKGYTSMYTESMELLICTVEGSVDPADFTLLSSIDELTSEYWSLYYHDLDDYAGQKARLAVRYTSYDAFLAQVDDVTVGPQSGQGEVIDYGNVVRFEIYLDGAKVGESETPEFTLPALTDGEHTVGIKAIYQNDASEMATYTISTSGILEIEGDSSDAPAELFDLSGRRVNVAEAPAGVYILRRGAKVTKVIL